MLTYPFANRLTPARPDLAADHLRGQVEAGSFVRGRPSRVTVGTRTVTTVPPRRSPPKNRCAWNGKASFPYVPPRPGNTFTTWPFAPSQ